MKKGFCFLFFLLFFFSLAKLWSAEPIEVPDFNLMPGDVVRIRVFPYETLERILVISPDYQLNYPLLSSPINVRGKSLELVAGEIAQELLTLIPPDKIKKSAPPQVQLEIIKKSKYQVYLMGEVAKPGTYELAPGQTLLEILSTAGGFGKEADLTQVRIMRENREIKLFNLKKALQEGVMAENPVLKTGDIIYLTPLVRKITVLGGVPKPGIYDYQDGLTIMDVLAQTGNLTEDASLEGAVVIRNQTDTIPVNLASLFYDKDLKENIPLQAGDIILLPLNTRKVLVLGTISKPGVYPLEHNERIASVVAKVGWTLERSNWKQVGVIRRDKDDKINKFTVNLGKILENTDPKEDLVLQSGDIIWVPESSSLNWDRVLHYINPFLWWYRGGR